MKLSTDKVSLPGAKQVFRFCDSAGKLSRDVIGLQDESISGGTPLLTQVMAGGRRTSINPALGEIRERFAEDFRSLEDRYKELDAPPRYPVSISPRLEQLAAQVRERILGTHPPAI
jgi:nicotinate phosphoribosyltransferase